MPEPNKVVKLVGVRRAQQAFQELVQERLALEGRIDQLLKRLRQLDALSQKMKQEVQQRTREQRGTTR